MGQAGRMVLAVAAVLAGCVGHIEPLPVRPGSPDLDQDRLRDVQRGPGTGRRLTREEVFNSVDSALGVALDRDAFDLPADTRVPGGFRNGVAEQLMSPARVRAYDEIAASVADAVDAAALVADLAPCTDFREACENGLIDGLAVRVLRGPIPPAERSAFRPLFRVVEDEGDGFEAAARLLVRAMVMSPRFLYRLEDADGPGGPDGTRVIDPFALATRLAFLVWNAAPDAELLDLAARGRLEDRLEAETRRLLAHPRARRALRQFVEQWLYLDALRIDPALQDPMKEEVYRLVETVVWQEEGDLLRIFADTRAELPAELAAFYGLTPQGDGVASYDLRERPDRSGVLTRAGVMAARTINPRSSMIDRGLFVLNDVFCRTVPPPEGEALREAIEEGMVPETSGLSQRERFATQSEDPLCASCHGVFDPLGLPFETFGAFGEHLTDDEFGNPLTGAGEVQLGDLDLAYANAREFSEALAGSETVARCMVEKGLHHAYGRRLHPTLDAALIDEVHARFEAGGRSYQALLTAIATHPDFPLLEVSE
ncbi:MAG: DUF1592 domain-containing protein [Sandaracinaceae bacterium]